MNPSTSCPRFNFKIEFFKISGREKKHIFAGFKGDDDFLVEREAKQRGGPLNDLPLLGEKKRNAGLHSS